MHMPVFHRHLEISGDEMLRIMHQSSGSLYFSGSGFTTQALKLGLFLLFF